MFSISHRIFLNSPNIDLFMGFFTQNTSINCLTVIPMSKSWVSTILLCASMKAIESRAILKTTLHIKTEKPIESIILLSKRSYRVKGIYFWLRISFRALHYTAEIIRFHSRHFHLINYIFLSFFSLLYKHYSERNKFTYTTETISNMVRRFEFDGFNSHWVY